MKATDAIYLETKTEFDNFDGKITKESGIYRVVGFYANAVKLRAFFSQDFFYIPTQQLNKFIKA